MYLKELTINGFKSFAKKGELEFSAPITAIVGPNGSGKSNIAESFRFVLGEQSVKSMRGKRGEDLIWGGSDSVSRGNRASVEIVLDNSARVFPLDFDAIVIERSVHRDGQNEYKINGAVVRLKDVQELLSSAHIGASGHHIISQGEADRILSASAKERREMLEDALGLRVYQYKKQEAQRKLEKTLLNIEQVESLRREHAPHLKYLKKQVERAEKSLALQAELKTVYAEYLKREDVYLAYHIDRLQTKRKDPAYTLADITKQLAQAKQLLRDAGTKKDTTALLEVESELQTARAKKQELFKAMSQIEGQVSYLEKRLLQKQQHPTPNVSDELVPLVKIKELFTLIVHDIEKGVVKDDVSTLRRLLQDVASTLQLFIKKVEPAVVAMDTESEERELKELQKECQKISHSHEKAQEYLAKVQATYDNIKQSIEAEVSETHDAEKAVFELVSKSREVELELERIDRELMVLERDREEFKRELGEAVALIQSAATHYFKFEIIENGEVVTNDIVVAEERIKQSERRRQLEKLKIRLEELGIGATEDVLKEYQNALERDEFLAREIADLTASVDKLTDLIEELTSELHSQFVVGVEKITKEFTTFFTLMFGGGNAILKRVKPKIKKTNEDGDEIESEDESVSAEGVEIDVALPNKKVRGLDMLSGGERALTSIALIFAMSQVNPPPFIILDETDAALDEANSRRYGDMIEALAKKSQLILITHNRETMSRAGILYGITMGGDGVSKLLSVKFDDAVAVVAKN
ncbi:MAG: AAA family ATPase [Candidatus Paceibacteria bacterium]